MRLLGCFVNLFSVGRPKHVRIMAGGVEGDTFIGPKAEEHRGLLHIKYPMEVGGCVGVSVSACGRLLLFTILAQHGIVTDWNHMEMIWNVSMW